MNKIMVVLGIIILLAGLFFAFVLGGMFGIMPIGKSAQEMADDRSGNGFESYDEGDEIIIHGKII